MAPVVTSVLSSVVPGATSGSSGSGGATFPSNSVSVLVTAAAERLVLGASSAGGPDELADVATNTQNMAVVEQIVNELDTPVQPAPNTFVLRLENARSVDVATLLKSGLKSNTRSGYGGLGSTSGGRSGYGGQGGFGGYGGGGGGGGSAAAVDLVAAAASVVGRARRGWRRWHRRTPGRAPGFGQCHRWIGPRGGGSDRGRRAVEQGGVGPSFRVPELPGGRLWCRDSIWLEVTDVARGAIIFGAGAG